MRSRRDLQDHLSTSGPMRGRPCAGDA
jgi:hypothetical protein